MTSGCAAIRPAGLGYLHQPTKAHLDFASTLDCLRAIAVKLQFHEPAMLSITYAPSDNNSETPGGAA